MKLKDILKAHSEGQWVRDHNEPTNFRVHLSDVPKRVEMLDNLIGAVGHVFGINKLEANVTGGGESRKYKGALVVAFSALPSSCAAIEQGLDEAVDRFFRDNGVRQLEFGEAVHIPAPPQKRERSVESMDVSTADVM